MSGSMSLSSATIRNEMSELEQLGLLEQPHTSTGRVPSSNGYRIYVENLMNEYYLSLEEISVLNEIMTSKIKRLNTVVEDITKVPCSFCSIGRGISGRFSSTRVKFQRQG